jgi:hypothetical protein
MKTKPEVIPTRESVPDTIEYAEFDVYYDEARAMGHSVVEAGLIAGGLIMGLDVEPLEKA